MISIKVKNPEDNTEVLEFPSKSKAIMYLLSKNVSKPDIKMQLNCTHQHIHITLKTFNASAV